MSIATKLDDEGRLIAVDYDHRHPDIVSSPHDLWSRMRAECPVSWSEEYGGFWFVSTFDLVNEIVVDWKRFTSTESTGLPRQASQHLPVHVDPPEHRRYRSIINPSFAPQAVATYEPWIREIAAEAVAGIADPADFDLCTEFTDPFPQAVIMRLAGFPVEDLVVVADWIDSLIHGTRDDDSGATAVAELDKYLIARLDERSTRPPGPDLLSIIEQGTVEGRPLTRDEQVRMLIVLLLGGLATTSGSISGTLLWLAQHDEERRALIADPSLWATAAEEFVRYTSPVAQLSRVATSETNLAGCPVHAGDRILLGFGSANRDDSKFEEPDEVVLDRFPNLHLGFGAGPHRCVGSHLAKLQLQIAVEEFLRRFPDFTVDVDSAVWRGAEDRGLAHLRAHA